MPRLFYGREYIDGGVAGPPQSPPRCRVFRWRQLWNRVHLYEISQPGLQHEEKPMHRVIRKLTAVLWTGIGSMLIILFTGTAAAQQSCSIEVSGEINSGYLNTGSGTSSIGHQGYRFQVVYAMEGAPGSIINNTTQQFLRWFGPAVGGADNQSVSVAVFDPAGNQVAAARSLSPGTNILAWGMRDLSGGDDNVLDHSATAGEYMAGGNTGVVTYFRAYFQARSATNVFDSPIDYLTVNLAPLEPASGRDQVIVNGSNNFYIRIDNAVTATQGTRYAGGCHEIVVPACSEDDILPGLAAAMDFIGSFDEVPRGIRKKLQQRLGEAVSAFTDSGVDDLQRYINSIAAMDGFFDYLWSFPAASMSSGERIQIMATVVEIKDTMHCLYDNQVSEDNQPGNDEGGSEDFMAAFDALYGFVSGGQLEATPAAMDALMQELDGIVAIISSLANQPPSATDMALVLGHLDAIISIADDLKGREIHPDHANRLDRDARALQAIVGSAD